MPDAPSETRSLRQRIGHFVADNRFQHLILALIVINAVLLGLETSPAAMAQVGDTLRAIDRVLLSVFVVELLLRLYAHRAAFFRDPWSVFDLIVVGIALVPASGPFAVLRALRVLRVLRVLTLVPSMRRVVGALLSAIPGLSSIALVLLLVFYVFGVIATHLFGQAFPEWFGHLGRSLYTLFQVMTLESWSMGISRPVMEQVPYAWAFFIVFILFATFTMLNLFIAIIVNAMQTFSEGEHQSTVEAVEQVGQSIEHEIHAEVQSLRQELGELKALLREAGLAAPRPPLSTPHESHT
ncbi:MAG TPA: ion transporter [Hydrogenophaga sp.]|uniref:ion transporter n=1 Tax=Hydrogenophaga sp. TaxID=1904254 RepID=UPI002BAC1D5A|nr:ion transporter [Hydrogenophaga sp.]HMN93725.1 ion transporter [Hydrogenophaga sp.]HMP09158.1 ion transporter [Hydrogenophaga sp.]